MLGVHDRPFIAAYNVANVGVSEADLAVIYFAGGATSLVTAQVIGRLADRYGKQRVFTILALISIGPILVQTHLPPLPLAWVVALSVLLFVFVPGRFGPATALVTGSVEPSLRGSFMSFNASSSSWRRESRRSRRAASSGAHPMARSRTSAPSAGCRSAARCACLWLVRADSHRRQAGRHAVVAAVTRRAAAVVSRHGKRVTLVDLHPTAMPVPSRPPAPA